MIGVGLALASALAHAAWNLSASRTAGGGVAALWLVTVTGLVLVVPVAVVATLATGDGIDWRAIALAPGSAVLHAAYMGMILVGYRVFEVSAVYPVARGLAPLLVAVAGALALGQGLNGWGLGGVGAMAGAVALFTASHTRPHAWRAMAFGAGVAVATSAYTLYDGWAIVSMGADPITFYASGAAIQALVLSAIIGPQGWRTSVARARDHPWSTFALAVLVPASYVLGLLALDHAPLALVTAVRGSSIIWVGVAAAVFLRERISPARGLATGLAAGAIALFAVGAS